MRFLRWLFGIVFLALLGLGITYYIAGRAPGPAIRISEPTIVGLASPLDVSIEAPGRALDAVTVGIEQRGQTFPVLALDGQPAGMLKQDGPDRVRITGTIGKRLLPQLQAGAARVIVTASRPVFRGLRHAASQAVRDVQVQFEPPRISVVSTKHYINLGGSEMIVYRVTPPDVQSGVRVGALTYPGFAASGAGPIADPSLKVAFFALSYDQPIDAPMELYAKDAAGNQASAPFEHQVFPKRFRSSRIAIDDAFLGRVVPAILQQSPKLGMQAPSGDLLPAFLKINNDLRRMNGETIAALAQRTSPTMLWKGAFQPLGGSQVEAAFADYRTYIYRGQEVDRQVHLGFDLAKVVNSPIAAANDGKVLYAHDLGIYGNCVILDHGMGVESLYGHMSSFQVQEGQDVRKGQTLGLTGETGLAGGDHLHFSMIVNGRFVNATEWWDPHWIQDRITRKLVEAGGSSPATAN